MPSRRRAALWAGSGLVMLAFAACAQHPEATSPPLEDATSGLYARAFYDIGNYYLEPVADRALGLAGARNVVRLDRDLAIAETSDAQGQTKIALSYRGRQIAAYDEPVQADADGWGRLLAALDGDVRRASPQLARLPQDRLDEAVLDGVVGGLDRFSRYAGPAAARDHRALRDGFGGVGILFEQPGDSFRVAAVTPDGPAERAGVRPHDTIVAVDGEATAGRSERAVSEQLRGPPDSVVALTLRRPDVPGERDLRITRAQVCVPTVTMSQAHGIARFRVTSFNRDTAHEVAQQLAVARRQAGGRLAGIVLDLRGNPGGLLDQAVQLVDLFVSSGPVVATTGRHPASRQLFAAKAAAAAPRVPLAVLVDGGSASAAEIVAAALQDAGRAVVIGSASYGKGTVQTVLRLPNDGELTLTWARLVAPSGYLLQHHGVVPTVCTSDLGDGAAALRTALARAGGADAPSPLTLHPRRQLDDAAWQQLRRSCPPRRDDRDIDIETADHLLADAALYATAVREISAGPRLAGSAKPPLRTGLTAVRASLLSGPRSP